MVSPKPGAARATRIVRAATHVSRGAAAGAAAVAVVGLGGFYLGAPSAFWRLPPNTAVTILLLSFALLALGRRAAVVAAALAAIVAAATLVEFAGVELGIDRLLVPRDACLELALCGRSSLNSTVAVLLLSASIVLTHVRSRRARRVSQLFAGIVLFTSLAALAGYVYGAPPLYAVPGTIPETGMSVHAAVSFTALAAGVFCARPRAGLMAIVTSELPGGGLARRFLVAAAFAPMLGFVFMLGARAHVLSPGLAAALTAVTAMLVAVPWVLATARRLDDAERRRRAIDKRYRAFVEDATDAILIADLSGHHVDVNRAACELLGFTRGELLEMAFSDLVAPEEVGSLAEVRERLLSGGRDRREWHVCARDGERIPVEVSASITPEGQWQASIRDIRDRRRLEAVERERLRSLSVTSDATLAFSRALADAPSSGVDAVLSAIAEEAMAATGADAAMLDLHDRRTVHAGSRARISHELSVRIRRGDLDLGTLRVEKTLGAAPFTVEDALVLDALAPRAALVIESARAFEREQHAHARLEALLDSMPAGVELVARDGASPVRNRFLEPYVDDRGALALLRGETLLPEEEHPIRRALRTGETVVERLALASATAPRVPVLVTAAPVPGASGEPVSAVATFQDIAAIDYLERLREEWNSVVAHELRQPLGTIDLAAQLLERVRPQTPIASDAVSDIRRAAERLDRMLHDLTDLSRLEARRLDVRPRPTDLRALIDDIVMRSPLTIEVTETGARRGVEVDPARLEQVLDNLLSNAAKYRRPETPVEIALEWRADDVIVSVTNESQGAGLTDDDAAHVFDRFVRSKAAKSSGASGLGVGLYIARGLVEAHGGRMWVDTGRPGRTSFALALPVWSAARSESGFHRVGGARDAGSRS